MKKGILIAGLLFTAVACNNVESNNKTKKEEVHAEEQTHEHHQEKIELNKGEKWVVDPEMMKHIRNMERSVVTFDEASAKEYGKLAKELQKEVELLTSNCTMTGKAHDELHKWLLPYIDLVDELSNTDDTQQAQETYTKIIDSFTTFNHYFV